jgi:peptidoglycan/xylan/chitin deacetylase (PgdA/CDA1 family)
VKRAVELALTRSGLIQVARRMHRQDVLVLSYHNVVPDGAEVRGDRSLHIGQEQLHRQLSTLSRTHHLIPIDGIRDASAGKARVAVTFDDAYRGAIQLGIEVLADLNVPATVFVAPSCLGAQRFWWDILSNEQDVAASEREFALSELQGKASAVLAWAGLPSDQPDPSLHTLTATEAELATALAIDGVTLGSHTWSHPNLTALLAAEIQEELDSSLRWLRERYPHRTVDWLSYPYGRWSRAVADAARRVGYSGAFRIAGGWIRKDDHPFALPRLNVPAGLSLEGLELRSSGLLPL